MDIRYGSPTFGRCTGAVLNSENNRQLCVPEGFAHGFCVLSKNALFHYMCSDGALTRYAFPRKIIALARPYENLVVKDVVSILTQDYPIPAPRPQYSVLDCSSFMETFGISRRPWDVVLKEMLADLYAS